MKRITGLADRLVTALAGKSTAGACVGNVGQIQTRWGAICGCEDGRAYRYRYSCEINCDGSCIQVGPASCLRTGNTC
ncbi:hypothetical protein Afil01_02880 [Actinorhabdospora filicis]|uniref:Uncharacterized protein n=1 Tax=Actinorhabdospora filicis TaxID=1785913 RepID=A0A9W6SHC9_9ACTN|nr:hypothetical protein [Actinorhabdospora filicis]GLZ75481.1 hypothetical protein Afil01_02880 [Actinorhabdospora filicis]